MNKDKKEKLNKEFFQAGLMAILKHKKTKSLAKANGADNFSLVAYGIANDVVMNGISLLEKDDMEWFNDMHDGGGKKYEAFVLSICHEAHKILV